MNNIENVENLRFKTTVRIFNTFCPLCGARIAYQLPEEYPVFLTSSCTSCKTWFSIKFDYNSFRIDIPYELGNNASRSNT